MLTTKIVYKDRSKKAVQETKDLAGTRIMMLAIMIHRWMVTHFTPSRGGGRKHKPSPPGQPPAVRTGRLRSGLVWELDTGTSSKSGGSARGATRARIGVPKHVIYGIYHELGAPKIGLPKRPFMWPAVKAVMSRVGTVFNAKIGRA